MERSGWISIYRKILDNPIICKDSDHYAVWGYLLLEATHKSQKKYFKGGEIILQRGQLITGRKAISEHFKINESKVQRVLKKFENEHLIEQETSSQNRLITIVNYDYYQNPNTQNEQQVNNERTTSEQQVNTNNNVNTVNTVDNGTLNNTSENAPISIEDETKTDIELQKYIDNFEELWAMYPNKEGKSSFKTKEAYKRKKIKQIYQDREDIKKSIINYKQKLKDDKTDPKYTKHGSTFFNGAWQDYVNYQSPKSNQLTYTEKTEEELWKDYTEGMEAYGNWNR